MPVTAPLVARTPRGPSLDGAAEGPRPTVMPGGAEGIPRSRRRDPLPRRARATAKLLGIVAVPERLAVLRILAEGERRVGELRALVGVRYPSTFSHHLAALRGAGLVEGRGMGHAIDYRLTARGRATSEAVASLLAPG